MTENFIKSPDFVENEKTKFLARTYGWMSLALLLSAVSAWIAAHSPAFTKIIWGISGTENAGTPVGFIILAVAEIALVWFLGAKIRKMKLSSVIISFIAYSIINGLTLSSIFFVYQLSSVAYCFLASAVMFAAMSIYGMKTKSSLNKAGKYLMMALVGLIAISLANLLITLITHTALSVLDWIISLATVVIFAGLTAYDSQKILRAAEFSDGQDDYKKLSVYAALQIYLDFINIFLSLLRLFGKRRN